MKRIISVLLENESGALSRVVGLFSQRGYNIESITVAPTEDSSISKITIQTMGDKKIIEQIEKQLHKLIDVLRVTEIEYENHLEREIILIKIKSTTSNTRKEIKQITDIFEGIIVNVTSLYYIIQLSGTSNKIDSYLAVIRNISEIIEISRSGVIGISRN
ncbi:acetolactate synthase 3 regulatory subunit [Buchnera aphidicola (Schlechtendalia chinensis)]|uniref:Acetolactate synthase small subunit n=1 Tax=Buchnera aphidicola subsp. Schlechtendalia chinensis TaxID=118110 RepID=A0A172WED5_BUCSC|nr:acetolactate synthase small subunit [Buchnera aphidicola]ANF17302.1 acetolactate synthase 3 regulatory subunit [Buchnera aphidicola (Schlechtendalia chinensis)]